MSAPEFIVEYDCNAGPEDREAGLCYDVRHRENWQDGRYLPPVAQRCPKYWADIICDLLNARNALDSFGP